MRIDALGKFGSFARFAADAAHASGADGLTPFWPGKEPGFELIAFPVVSQQGQEFLRQHHAPVALAFALSHMDDHALGVDIAALQVT